MNIAVNGPWEVLCPPGVRSLEVGNRGRGWLMPVLIPASWLYQVVSNAVRSARSAGEVDPPSGLLVVSIGNLEVGGSGKTPLAMRLVERIAEMGGRPVYVSRGFGGVAERLDVVTVIPGASDEASVTAHARTRRLNRQMDGLAVEIGDEGAMVARRIPGVPLLFSRNKARALELAGKALNATHAVMDDAFQSWGVPRHVDVVLVDGERPLGDGWLLPAGRLREPGSALERATMIGVTGVGSDEALSEATAEILRSTGVRKPTFGIRRNIDVDWNEGESETGGRLRYAALSAIGQPVSFERQLASRHAGLELAVRYPDHHRYTAEDVAWVVGEADKRGIRTLVTTEKDWAKLRELGTPVGRFAVARLTLELFGEDPLAHIKRAAD